MDRRIGFDPVVRNQKLVQAMENHVQMLMLQSDKVRDEFFLYKIMPELADNRWSTARRHPKHPPEKFIEGAKPYRRIFSEDGMGDLMNLCCLSTLGHEKLPRTKSGRHTTSCWMCGRRCLRGASWYCPRI